MKKILVIEDEVSINDILTTSLKREGYDVRFAYDGTEGLKLFESFKPSLVILDLMLPDMKGEDICKKVCKSAYVIMLTAKNSISDKLNGMEIGADDYITKPFDIREVKMRVKVILRREDKAEISVDLIEKDIGLNVDLEKRLVIKNGNTIKLSKKEFDIIALLYTNKNIVFSRDQLLDKVWGYDYFGEDRTVDVHIRRLREKLGEDRENSIVETVFGVGYVMR